MTTTIKPALTAEEWQESERDSPGQWLLPDSMDWGSAPEDWHRIAALCLRGQPFGFTWEGHDAISEVIVLARQHVADCLGLGGGAHLDAPEWRLLDAAEDELDKIEALLPPREA